VHAEGEIEEAAADVAEDKTAGKAAEGDAVLDTDAVQEQAEVSEDTLSPEETAAPETAPVAAIAAAGVEEEPLLVGADANAQSGDDSSKESAGSGAGAQEDAAAEEVEGVGEGAGEQVTEDEAAVDDNFAALLVC
jgi:hypothetical protein